MEGPAWVFGSIDSPFAPRMLGVSAMVSGWNAPQLFQVPSLCCSENSMSAPNLSGAVSERSETTAAARSPELSVFAP
jgi:hypothetical protein